MQYQLEDGWTSVSFVRPAHGLVALHGDEVVPVRALGLDAGPDDARPSLRRQPRADRRARRAQLREAAARRGRRHRRLRRSPRRDPAPAAGGRRGGPPRAGRRRRAARRSHRAGRAAERARLPLRRRVPRRAAGMPGADDEGEPEATFRCSTPDGALTNRFLVVSNIAPADPARIVEGNERVVRPRLADAKFFYDQDRKRTLESRVPGARQGRLPRQARQPGRPDAAPASHRASRSPSGSAPTPRTPIAPRCSPRSTC